MSRPFFLWRLIVTETSSKKEALVGLLRYLKALLVESSISGKRNRSDFIADRIVQAATKPSLIAFAERFASLIGAAADVYPETTRHFVAAATGPHASALLQMLRRYPRVVTQMLFVTSKAEDGAVSPFDALMAGLDVEQLAPSVDTSADKHRSVKADHWDVPIVVTCLSPLAHGADTKAGNATLFRRMDVLGEAGGEVMQLPFYAGNALRGQMRDLLAVHLHDALGAPKLALWFFHALFAGGALVEGGIKLLDKALGANGAVKVEGMRRFRDMLPALSALGGALGSRILSGRVMVGDLRPRCIEWGAADGLPAAELFDWQYLTRRDDNAENRAEDEAHHGMIAMTETLKSGTVLDGGICFCGHESDLERAAIARGLLLLREHGFLGAENRRGFGQVSIEFGAALDPTPYDEFLVRERGSILAYLDAIGALEAAPCTPST